MTYCKEFSALLDPYIDGELSPEEFKSFSPAFEEDVYDAVSMKTCVEKRLTLGAPGRQAMEQVIAINRKYLQENGRITE